MLMMGQEQQRHCEISQYMRLLSGFIVTVFQVLCQSLAHLVAAGLPLLRGPVAGQTVAPPVAHVHGRHPRPRVPACEHRRAGRLPVGPLLAAAPVAGLLGRAQPPLARARVLQEVHLHGLHVVRRPELPQERLVVLRERAEGQQQQRGRVLPRPGVGPAAAA
eukprot:CAMPEP_0194679034 /NCGR_PEP_ID=MMETSP0295-20121207/10534_1 /TAXON_ID=39354 /ORGANISM="Heterosigma akashiwo, Strain CCMP2393" /LENGTH=161 /DNA_ID=CAMNT_0039564325 /DNA_START=532 /DNA_END=1013 /DNA_ORIENTATION=+